MLLKKRLIIAFIIMILSLPEGKPCMAMKSNGEMVVSNYSKGKMEDFNMKLKSKKKKNRYDVSAGDDFFVFGNGDDCKVGEKVICKTYVCHLKAGETVSITWDWDKELKSGDFEIGLINKKSGEEVSRKIGKVSNKTKKIEISKTGTYYFYFCAKKANCKNGTVEFCFDVSINKKKV